jgi:hypothetical protein
MMDKPNEVVFLVEEAPEGGYTARALGESIFTEAETISELHEQVRYAVRVHFEEGQEPRVIRILNMPDAHTSGPHVINESRHGPN